nr:hypothetical protein [Rathayibacter sp. SD072]
MQDHLAKLFCVEFLVEERAEGLDLDEVRASEGGGRADGQQPAVANGETRP